MKASLNSTYLSQLVAQAGAQHINTWKEAKVELTLKSWKVM